MKQKSRDRSKTREGPQTPSAKPATDESARPEMEPISIVPFTNLSLPDSYTIRLAYGALDTKGIAYFSVQPFGSTVLDEALRANRKDKLSFEHINIIWHNEHHLAPISWLMIQVPRQQPFLKRVRNRINKEAKIRDPENHF
jgi:hypothetical protein